MTPQGTLSQIDNPLVQGSPQPLETAQPTPQPSGTDTAQGPAAGLDTLSNPKQQRPFGGASLGSILLGKGQSLPSVVSPHVSKIGDSIQKTITENPEAASKPGGVMRAVVAGGLQALSGIGAGLGDVGNIGTVPAGAGGLYGMGKTLQARNTRLQEADKNSVMMAEANTRMIHEQRLISKLDDEARQTSVDSGQRQIQLYRSQPSPVPALAEHLDSDQITQFIQEKKLDPTKETAIPDGMKVVGTDKNGNPIKRMTYTLMGVPADITLDDKYKGSKDVLEELNKYAPPANGGKWTEGQHFTGTEFNLAMQHAADVRAATLSRNQSLIQSKLADQNQVRDMESVNFRGVSDWVNALSQTPNGDVMAARTAMLSNADMRSKYPNLDNDLREYYGKDDKGVYNYDKLLEKHQEKIDQGIESIITLQKDLNKAHGEEAASIGAGLKARIKNPTDADKLVLPKLQRMADQADQQAKASLDYDALKKEQDQRISDALEEENLPVLIQAADNYQLDPNKLYTMRKGANANFKAKMLEKDPTWSEAKYKQRYNMQLELASDKANSMGGQVESLNRFAMHTADANRGIQGLRNLGSPIIDKPINAIKEGMVGFPEAQSFMIEAETAKDEFLNFIKNGHVPPTTQEERLAASVNTSKTPAELQSIFRSMAKLVAARTKAMNGRYSTIMGGGNIPGLIQPDTDSILRQFGVDVDAIYNTTGTTSFSSPINGNPAQQKASQNLPPAPKGMVRIRTPNGTLMNIPESQAKTAADNGAVIQ